MWGRDVVRLFGGTRRFSRWDIEGLSHIYCLNRIIGNIARAYLEKLYKNSGGAMSELHSECFTLHVR